jgi:hypothetical protein
MHKVNAWLEDLIRVSACFISEVAQRTSWCCRRKVTRALHETQIEFYKFSRKLQTWKQIVSLHNVNIKCRFVFHWDAQLLSVKFFRMYCYVSGVCVIRRVFGFDDRNYLTFIQPVTAVDKSLTHCRLHPTGHSAGTILTPNWTPLHSFNSDVNYGWLCPPITPLHGLHGKHRLLLMCGYWSVTYQWMSFYCWEYASGMRLPSRWAYASQYIANEVEEE